MRVTVVQPAIPAYRVKLFERLASAMGSNFSVYSSRAEDLGVLGTRETRFEWQRDLGPMRPVLPGLEWQTGALGVPVGRGDVLVVCGAPRTLSTLALLLKGKLRGARIIWWGHYWSSTSRPWRAVLRFALMRLSDAILFYTDQEVLEYKVRQGKGVAKPVMGLNNGIETGEIVRMREPYEGNGRARDLLFIGRLTAKAELELLLEALARPECSAVTLDVIGDAPGCEWLKEAASVAGILERIAWHEATVDEARIAAIANRCKVFVYPGSVGLSLIHGMAYGLPSIVHDDRWSHMPEIAAFEEGVTGRAFRKGDAASLSQIISRMLSDGKGRERMSREAIALTDRTFNTSDMAERFLRGVGANGVLAEGGFDEQYD